MTKNVSACALDGIGDVTLGNCSLKCEVEFGLLHHGADLLCFFTSIRDISID
jgi:hypothetical protein